MLILLLLIKSLPLSRPHRLGWNHPGTDQADRSGRPLGSQVRTEEVWGPATDRFRRPETPVCHASRASRSGPPTVHVGRGRPSRTLGPRPGEANGKVRTSEDDRTSGRSDVSLVSVREGTSRGGVGESGEVPLGWKYFSVRVPPRGGWVEVPKQDARGPVPFRVNLGPKPQSVVPNFGSEEKLLAGSGVKRRDISPHSRCLPATFYFPLLRAFRTLPRTVSQ